MANEKDMVFKVGHKYMMLEFVNPIWPPDAVNTCQQVRNDGKEGLFSVGNDSRWWAANPAQFKEIQ